jgi:CRP-like cAMP-binding protein
MEDLNFARPQYNSIYDPAIALAFFKAAGTQEAAPQGTTFFSENEKAGGLFSKGAKMYYLLEGEVGLTVKARPIGTVEQGQIFGEMASISQSPRSATATAKTACRVISVDEKQFQKAIQKAPDFGLMLMSIVINRLRQVITELSGSSALADEATLGKRSVFDKKLLAELETEFEGNPPQHAPKNKVVMKEGEAGAFMYVVLEGRVLVSIKNRPVERLGPGGVLGEMALVDQSPRIASAMAEEDTSLLSINRRDFLQLIKTKPEFSLTLLKGLAERLKQMNAQLG